MSSLGSLPAPERYPHGTRARYVSGGCRCDQCREANRLAYHARQRRGIELAAELAPAALVVTRTYPNGQRQRRACPGVFGEACVKGRLLRADSAPVCRDCRGRLSFNGLVSAAAARKHIRSLGSRGVGYKSIADAASLAPQVVLRVRGGKLLRVRVETARKILAVDVGARAGGARVAAHRTWARLDALIARGYTKVWIARQLGQRGPGLQVGRENVTVSMAYEVQKLFERCRDAEPVGRRPRAVSCRCERPMPIRGFCARCERPMASQEEAAA